MTLRCSVPSRIELVGDGVSYFRPTAASKVVYPVGRDDSSSIFLESTSHTPDYTVFKINRQCTTPFQWHELF